jgi:hypothetical protein
MSYSFDEVKECVEFVLDSSQVQDLKPVWEKAKDDNGYKWVLTLHRLTWDNANVLYTKIIIRTDDSKSKLIDNRFSYLYELSCYYREVQFENLEDFKVKLERIFKDNKFGVNLKRISEFLVSPAMTLNEWFYKNKIDTISVFDFQYQPKFLVLPCKKLSFDFTLNINNKEDISITLKRKITETDNLTKDVYEYTFNRLNKFETVEQENLSTIVETVTRYLKDNYTINI